MLGSLQAEGQAIGVLADSLLIAATAQKWRKGLMNNDLVLISPFYPEAGFSVGNAMARNKYIYCLSEAAVIVHSWKKGGTWAGAIENLKKHWVPAWVKPTTDHNAGNAEIVVQGANWCAGIESLDIDSLCLQTIVTIESNTAEQVQDLFSIESNLENTEAVINEFGA